MHTITRKMRQRRELRTFERATRGAMPAMRQELGVAYTRANVRVF